MRSQRPQNCIIDELIPGSLWIERGWIQRIWTGVDPENFASWILDEVNGLWEPHRGFRGRPDFERLTCRISQSDTKSIYNGKKQKIHGHFQKGKPLSSLKIALAIFEGFASNFAYLNLYASGDAKLPYHSDTTKMPQLGETPTIVCISFGASRRFAMSSRNDNRIVETVINSGDLYVMHGNSQKDWEHSCPRDKEIIEPRLSITFRNHK